MDWWEVKSDVKPILSMDNFGKLNLEVLQGQEDKIGIVRTETEKLMFHTKKNQISVNCLQGKGQFGISSME